MRLFAFLSAVLLANLTYAQSNFPYFLAGTWKVENAEIYEHWDKLNSKSLKGYSYEIENNQTRVSEYLDLTLKGKNLIYTASVIGQNDGAPVSFKSTQSDSVFVFQNPKHDFPNMISYQKVSDDEILVVLYGDDTKVIYTMFRQNVAKNETGLLNPNYDTELATKLGGDDYGMKSYVFVILKTGGNKTTDKALIDSCFMGHMANITRLVEENKLVVAGPFGKNDKTYRGLFILNVTTLEEAQELLKTDPAVREGLLDYELVPWYGSAALPTYLEDVEKIWRSKF